MKRLAIFLTLLLSSACVDIIEYDPPRSDDAEKWPSQVYVIDAEDAEGCGYLGLIRLRSATDLAYTLEVLAVSVAKYGGNALRVVRHTYDRPYPHIAAANGWNYAEIAMYFCTLPEQP